VLPGVRRACDAYVRFVSGHDLLESVASSLTELAAGGLMAERIACFEKHYPWVKTDGLRYFRSRTEQAPRDARRPAGVTRRAGGPGALRGALAQVRISGACSTASSGAPAPALAHARCATRRGPVAAPRSVP
jgi:pyrroloquinoline-quinone synthase